jgi:hypothetical protein
VPVLDTVSYKKAKIEMSDEYTIKEQEELSGHGDEAGWRLSAGHVPL